MNVVEETTELRRVNNAALESALESLFSYKEHMVEQTHRLLELAQESAAL
jgi:hypothetical protein